MKVCKMGVKKIQATVEYVDKDINLPCVGYFNDATFRLVISTNKQTYAYPIVR